MTAAVRVSRQLEQAVLASAVASRAILSQTECDAAAMALRASAPNDGGVVIDLGKVANVEIIGNERHQALAKPVTAQ